MVIILLLIVIGLSLVNLQKLYRWTWKKPVPVEVKQAPDTTMIEAVVKEAFSSVGLPSDQFSMDFNLQRTGKLQDILTRSANGLAINHHLCTVGDVVAYLSACQHHID